LWAVLALLIQFHAATGEEGGGEDGDVQTWTILGRVLTSGEDPLEGAVVSLDTPLSPFGSIVMETGPGGEFETEISIVGGKAIRLRGLLSANKAGYVAGREMLDLEANRGDVPIDIVLRTTDEEPEGITPEVLIARFAPRLKDDAAAKYPGEGSSEEFERGCEALIVKRQAVDAVPLLQTVAGRTPDCLECRLLLSLALLDAGSWTSANNRLVEVSEKNNAEAAPRPEPDILMGVLRSWRGEIKDAVASYLHALEFEPGNAFALHELGRMLVAQGNWEAADHYLEKAILAGADDGARILRAEALLELGDAAEANREMESYLEKRKLKVLPRDIRALHSRLHDRLTLLAQEQVRSVIAYSPGELLERFPALQGLEAASDQGPLEDILARTGGCVEEFFANMTNTASREQVHQERLRKDGKVTDALDQEFMYIMLADSGGEGLGIKEYRSTESGRDTTMGGLKHGFMLTSGFASVPSLFHPANRKGADFRYLGRQGIDGRETDVVAFAQKSESARAMTRFITDKGSSLILVHGLAWIDVETSRILRLSTYLLNPLPEVRLQKLSTEIRFHGIEFAGIDEPLWLPEQVGISVDWRGRLLRNHHRYSDFKIFNVESRDEKKKLTEKDEQRLKEMSAGLPADSGSEAPAEPPAEPPSELR